MSLLDKFKNLFTDEEEIEEEIPIKNIPKKEENALPTFMREKIEREEGIKNNLPIENTSDLARQIPKSEINPSVESNLKPQAENNQDENNNFKFPIAFEEKDFVETTRQSKQNIIYQEQTKKKEQEELKKKKTSEIYGSKKEKKEVPKFKATPIISPVYGVLDKNYTKEEVKVNDTPEPLSSFEPKVPVKQNIKVDFESVRKKAYGSLTDELKDNLMCENCELLKEARRIEQSNEQDLLHDMKEKNNQQGISLEEAEENYYDFGVSYEPIHNYTEESDEKVKIVNHLDNDTPSEQIEIKEPEKKQPSVLSTLKKSMGDPEEPIKKEKKSIEDLELTDDLFNLIDSMYEERNDE
jgi:hypothetical protein